jgi:hypothetical protein
MRSFNTQLAAVAAAGLLAGLAATASAQVDHEKCYKIKDPIKLKGIVDLTTPQFGLEPGCKIGKAKYFCAPASKLVLSAVDKATGLPIVPLPLYAPDAPVDRICYKVKCLVPPPPFPPNQNVTDQFGNRTLTDFKASFICTPAVKGAGFCGNGVIDPGEACDFPALGACTVGCQADCTCTCPTACCYVDNVAFPAGPPDGECFEYTGTPAQVLAFQASCTNGIAPPAIGVPGSIPAGNLINSNVSFPGFVAAPCAGSFSPIFGTPCIPGPPGVGNLHVIPSDSTCP